MKKDKPNTADAYDDEDIPAEDLPKGVFPPKDLEVSPPWKEQPGDNS